MLPVSARPLPPNPAPNVPSVVVPHAAALPGRPVRVPGAGFADAGWHVMSWNHHLTLASGANIESNIILDILVNEKSFLCTLEVQ